MDMHQILGQSAVRAAVKVQSKKRALQEIAATAADLLGLSADKVLRALLEREDLGPTGVGHGVAIPHARIEGLDKVTGLFLRLESGIEFESSDGKPVDIVFALFAPAGEAAEHLRALARVSRTLRDEALCKKIRSTDDTLAIHALLTEHRTPTHVS